MDIDRKLWRYRFD